MTARTTTTAATKTGTCPVCGTVTVVVNYSPPSGWRTWQEGYLGRHHRPGTRQGTKCRGSFGGWVERIG